MIAALPGSSYLHTRTIRQAMYQQSSVDAGPSQDRSALNLSQSLSFCEAVRKEGSRSRDTSNVDQESAVQLCEAQARPGMHHPPPTHPLT
jgi:hypothetical protein